MPRLSLNLLGAPQIEHGGTPVRVSQRKPLALFAYLGVTGDAHTRDYLATLLWPDTESDRALAYLRNALWQLNQTAIGAWIDAERDVLALCSTPDLYIDVTAFEHYIASTKAHGHAPNVVCPACVAPLTEAADIYRGDFMEGFSLEDSATFDEWQFFQAEQLRQAATDALQKLTHYHSEKSRDELLLAIDYARRWLALDPANETAHQELIRLYALSDQRAAALRQYETCVRVLKEEIGVGPGKATVDLYRQVRSGALVPPSQPLAQQRAIQTPEEGEDWDGGGSSDGELPSRTPPVLPTPSTPFVGRREDLAEVCRLLAQPTCRLLSLVGPGGIGKTRLALEAAQQAGSSLEESYPDGVIFVPLSGSSTAEAAIAAIAEGLSPRLAHTYTARVEPTLTHAILARGDGPPEEEILDYLHPKRLLLVLDNLEHLVQAVDGAMPRTIALVEAILQAAPGVRLLVTSRERLNLRSEWVLTVTGMKLPTGDISTYEASGAVQLFIQSARRAAIGFDPSEEDLRSIARICRRVQGFPLAIELAAAWTRILSCQDIADEVTASFDFLSTSLRDVPGRHRSLRTIFEHTWTLLPEKEQEPLGRLAVFRSGFTREAAREVAGASLVTLSALLDRSILHESGSDAERNLFGRRYELHEMLRQYSEEKLRLSPEAYHAARTRHSHYYLTWLTSLEPALKGAEQKRTLDAISREVENIKAAWMWAADHEALDVLHQALLSLIIFFVFRDRYAEALRLLAATAQAIGRRPETEETTLIKGLIYAGEGGILSSLNRYTEAEQVLLKALEILEPRGDSGGLAFALSQASFAVAGSRETRIERLERSLSYYRQRGDAYGQADALARLSQLVADCGDDYKRSEGYLSEALALNRQLGNVAGTAEDLALFGSLAECRGDRRSAQEHYQEALALMRDLGNLRGISNALYCAADLERKLGNYETAREMFTEAAALAQEIGNSQFSALAVHRLGLLAFEVDDFATAERYLREAIATVPKSEGTAYLVQFLESELGIIAVAKGDVAAARDYLAQDDPGNLWSDIALGRLAAASGDGTAARTHFGKAIELSLATNGFGVATQRAAIPLVLICLADLDIREGHPESAAPLLGSALQHPLIHHHMRVQAEALLDVLRDTLTPDVLSAAMAEGSARDPEALAAGVLANEMGTPAASL